MDHSNKGQEFIEKYLAGTASDEERKLVERFYLERFKNDAFPETVTDAEQLKTVMWDYISAEADIATKATTYTEPSTKAFPLWKRLATAAAAVAVITLGVWLYGDVIGSLSKDNPESSVTLSLSKGNDIAPGRNTATLTLADGQVINLDTARTSIVVTDSVKTMTMLTATTPRGGTYQVILPDGTKVWLNADSKISFPSQFSERERKVVLTRGEAYFEVAKAYVTQNSPVTLSLSKSKPSRVRQPFIVESPGADGRSGQIVEVLGTHFNISSYADESNIKTTLLEGSVRISPVTLSSVYPEPDEGSKGREKVLRQAQHDITLKPGQQSVLTGSNQILVKEANVEQEMAWKNGYFRFNDEKIQSIMTKLARWYNIEVVYEDKVTTEGFTGTASRNKNISQVLRLLENTKGIRFKVEGRRVTVIN